MIRFNRSLIALVTVGLLLVPCTVGAQAVKDVLVVNPPTSPVPVVVQDGNGQPFEFTGTFSNTPGGTFPTCILPKNVFTVPLGETFVATDILLSIDSFNITSAFAAVNIQRDAVDILPSVFLGSAGGRNEPNFRHAFQTGPRFAEGEALNLAITSSSNCGTRTVGFLVTGIRTPS